MMILRRFAFLALVTGLLAGCKDKTKPVEPTRSEEPTKSADPTSVESAAKEKRQEWIKKVNEHPEPPKLRPQGER